MTSTHFNIRVEIEEVNHTDPAPAYRSAGNGANVQPEGKRIVRERLRLSVVADTMELALHKVAAHLAAEHPDVKVFEDADNVPANSRLISRPVRDNPQA